MDSGIIKLMKMKRVKTGYYEALMASHFDLVKVLDLMDKL